MARDCLKGIVFDFYGTLVDLGAVTDACKEVAPDPVSFSAEWRGKQLEYTFLRSLMGKYRDFWKVTEEALEFAIRRFDLPVTPDQKKLLMDAWLGLPLYPEVDMILSQLKGKYPLAILSNGTPKMLRMGLKRTAMRSHFLWELSADEVQRYKPSPQVYHLAPKSMRLRKEEILFISANPFDVVGATHFGFKVCWVNRTGEPPDPLGSRLELTVNNLEALASRL